MPNFKIPLFKSKSLGFERDMVSFSIKYGSLPSLYASAIIDTGCPFCIISENTIRRTRIPYRDKESMEQPVLLGGLKLELKKLDECEVSFRDENNKVILFKNPVYVGVPLNINQNQILIQQLPCFIGKDLLDKHYLSIIKSKDGNNYLQEIN